MQINIGSKNPSKIGALEEILKDYSEFKDAKIVSKDVDTGVSEQPKTLQETIEGAMARARNSFCGCNLSVGLESGIMPVPYTKSGYMDTTVCAIYDGNNFHLGLSSCFEYPPKVLEYMLKNNKDASSAFKDLNLTEEPYIGWGNGIIGVLTKDKLDRKGYTKQAIRTALIHLENKDLY